MAKKVIKADFLKEDWSTKTTKWLFVPLLLEIGISTSKIRESILDQIVLPQQDRDCSVVEQEMREMTDWIDKYLGRLVSITDQLHNTFDSVNDEIPQVEKGDPMMDPTGIYTTLLEDRVGFLMMIHSELKYVEKWTDRIEVDANLKKDFLQAIFKAKDCVCELFAVNEMIKRALTIRDSIAEGSELSKT